MKAPIKESLKKEMQRPQLDDKQLQALLGMQSTEQQARPASARQYWQQLSTAALLFLMLGLGFWLGGYQQQASDENIPSLIAFEVVNNHLKDKPMDVNTKAFPQLQSYFTKLDFSPFNSALWDGDLIGGRYCSLRTSPSAQIRYYDEKGVKQTLYQTEYSEKYFAGLPTIEDGEQPLLASAKGVEVSIWVEKGVVFVDTQALK